VADLSRLLHRRLPRRGSHHSVTQVLRAGASRRAPIPGSDRHQQHSDYRRELCRRRGEDPADLVRARSPLRLSRSEPSSTSRSRRFTCGTPTSRARPCSVVSATASGWRSS
jgi:hypothetical protein